MHFLDDFVANSRGAMQQFLERITTINERPVETAGDFTSDDITNAKYHVLNFIEKNEEVLTKVLNDSGQAASLPWLKQIMASFAQLRSQQSQNEKERKKGFKIKGLFRKKADKLSVHEAAMAGDLNKVIQLTHGKTVI